MTKQEYLVVTKDGVNNLVEEVNHLITHCGYVPQGGISVNAHNIYTQAMILEHYERK